ncbi:uncharacterized protein EV420DRAFT_1022711 [Desarmillaria tabescens]|uniref:C2H2-type domain-containing protein n=1 Tax=Armillaria tabescens TaxID=1929756 RepID=A0AA39JKM7_ARMTA|nr:uncharacterized protein EV420DRAFT_1022711 [Desarmillaria tabescens]KAK0443685.1 hypothetical protein EV420DRAFT_1022711 [Desarmillaria tabescens]
MARTHAKNPQKYPCEHVGCTKRFTRKNDVKRHAKLHLDGEQLESEKHTCPVTETGCIMASLQLGNVRVHIREKHPDVKDLVCFDCRPTFRLFRNATALAEHTQAKHPSTKILSHQPESRPSKPRRNGPKRPRDIANPPPPSTDSDSILPPPPTTPRRQKSPLSDLIIIPPSTFPKDDPEQPRDPDRPFPKWYRAPQPRPKVFSIRKKARDTSGIKKRARRPVSPAPSSSTAGGESSSSRFPLPPPPPSQLVTPVSSGAASPTHEREVIRDDWFRFVETRWRSPKVWPSLDRIWG